MFSKSQYTKYKSCPKKLWLTRNKKEVLSPLGEAAQKRMAAGQKIGQLAWKRFPNGVWVENGYQNPQQAVLRTQELMKKGVPYTYEAAFIYNDILVFVDILEKVPNGWNIIEVKSSGNTIDPIYWDDISIQHYVLSKCGVAVPSCYLMHINTDYYQTTDEPDLNQFFLLTLADPELTPLADIEQDLENIKAMLSADEPEVELDKTGCAECEAHDYCWRDIPEDSVFNLFRSAKARQYIKDGMPRVQDIPPDSLDNPNHNRWVNIYRTGQPYINPEGIAQWLNRLEYPLYYLDFETTQPVVPLWKNSKPYQQIPFQFSLHVQRKPNAEYEHYEYLSVGKNDPRPACAKALLEYIGDKGTIIAHNAGFEKARIKEMAHDLPLTEEEKERLLDMTNRFEDTREPFGHDYLLPAMKCRTTIKKVLPAVVPELTYEGMPVANGGDAMNAFDILYAQELPQEQLEQLRKDLLAYCKQDTWAMVKLVEALRDTVRY